MDKPININNRLFREREIKIGNRGYDVIRNCFFVEEVSEGRSPSYKKFPIFAEYFDYLNGDIYSSANYYKYNFSLEELNQFDIDLTKVKCYAITKETLRAWSKRGREKVVPTISQEALNLKSKLLQWSEDFCTCDNIQALRSASFAVQGLNEYKDFIYTSFALSNPERNIPLLLRLFCLSQNILEKSFITALCVFYGKDSFLDYIDSSFHKLKSEIKAAKKLMQEGEIIVKKHCYYNDSVDLFCITKKLVDTTRQALLFPIGSITVFYTSFDEFLSAINFDLSDCDISRAPFLNLDLSTVKTNKGTKLPLACIPSPSYYLLKSYDAKKDTFIVRELWQSAKKAELSYEQISNLNIFVISCLF